MQQPPGIWIQITQGTVLEGSKERPLPYQDVEITGNREGLLRLAEVMRRTAESEAGFHTHILPDDSQPIIKTQQYSLMIGLNPTK